MIAVAHEPGRWRDPEEVLHQLRTRPELLGPPEPQMGEPLADGPLLIGTARPCRQQLHGLAVARLQRVDPTVHVLRRADPDVPGIEPDEVDHEFRPSAAL